MLGLCTAFCAFIFVSGRIKVQGKQVVLRWLLFQLFLFLGAAGIVSQWAKIVPQGTDTDWSWIVPEVIKTPLWIQMFAQTSWLFFAAAVLFVFFLMYAAIKSPKNPLLWAVPLLACAALAWKIIFSFSETERDYPVIYFINFVCPMLIFGALMLFRVHRLAFRAAPIMLHLLMVGLNYIGALPVTTVCEVVPFCDSGQSFAKHIEGAELYYKPTSDEVGSSFNFLRRIFKLGDRLIVAYGPMGMTGVMSIDLTDRSVKKLAYRGLSRDIQPSPDGEKIWAVNWQETRFVVINPKDMNIECESDLYKHQITTPFEFIVAEDKIYISNVTYPSITELTLPPDSDGCALTPVRSINFYQNGYTDFTDGCYGMFVDRQRGRIFSVIGLLEGRYVSGFVESDLSDFRVLRDIRLPLANDIIPLPSKGTVLLPSYYYKKIFEVSLDDMRLRRTLESDPNLYLYSIAFDERRNLIYTSSRATGYLRVIDYESGKTIRRVPVGQKAEPLYFDRENDRLYIGSKAGIFKIDLKKFIDSYRGKNILN
jgi:hypothetical protein